MPFRDCSSNQSNQRTPTFAHRANIVKINSLSEMLNNKRDCFPFPALANYYHNRNLCERHSYSGSRNHIEASPCLQESLFYIQKWEIRVNGAKSVQVTFIIRKETCPPITLNNLKIPQAEDAKYLDFHLDRRLNWRKYIFTERK